MFKNHIKATLKFFISISLIYDISDYLLGQCLSKKLSNVTWEGRIRHWMGHVTQSSALKHSELPFNITAN